MITTGPERHKTKWIARPKRSFFARIETPNCQFVVSAGGCESRAVGTKGKELVVGIRRRISRRARRSDHAGPVDLRFAERRDQSSAGGIPNFQIAEEAQSCDLGIVG